MRRFVRCLLGIAVILMLAVPEGLATEDIEGNVIGAEADGTVTIAMPAGARITVGDKVQIQAEIEGVGWLAIETPWVVIEVTADTVRAAPEGVASGMPQVGYRAVVFATSNQSPPVALPTEPAKPVTRVYSGVHECDRLAAQPYDDQAVAAGVEYADLDEMAVIRACVAAIKEWPDTPRFYAQAVRGYYKAGQMKQAYELASRGADLGSAQAMAFLGIIYRTGAYVSQDMAQSLGWFVKSSEAGNVAGMIFAGSMYLEGEGTSPDAGKAAYWFSKAADLGNGQAMSKLAQLYDTGNGVTRDTAAAAALLLKAYALNDVFARTLLRDQPNVLSVESRTNVQKLLQAAGVYSGAIDGKFGPATRQALDTYARR